MYKREVGNIQGELLTVAQMAEVSNLGVTTVRKVAEEAQAIRRIGRCYRINKVVFLNYIEQMYS